jgi:hypothetical protein
MLTTTLLYSVKNRMMSDSLRNPKYPTWRSSFKALWNERGPNAPLYLRIRPFYSGYLVTLVRAFPVNSLALLVFETTMAIMGAEKVCLSLNHGCGTFAEPISFLTDYHDMTPIDFRIDVHY